MARPKDGTTIMGREGKPVVVIDQQARREARARSDAEAAQHKVDLEDIERSKDRVTLPSQDELVGVLETVFPIKQGIQNRTVDARLETAHDFIAEELLKLQRKNGGRLAPWQIAQKFHDLLSYKYEYKLRGCGWYFDEYLQAIFRGNNDALREARAWSNTESALKDAEKGGRTR